MTELLSARSILVTLFAACLVLPSTLAVAEDHQDADSTTEQDVSDSEIRKHVVKVWSSRRNISLVAPWKRGEISKTTGSGVWLGDGKILTNAHVAIYSSQLDVQPYDSSERISAEIEAISPEMDLAILRLEDSAAFAGIQPLLLATEMPKLRSSVQVYGYPTGGAAISVTEGVVSRIEYVRYKYGVSGLRFQIDAGINPGNSGGPTISDGRIIGLVSSRLRVGDNIGYIIPGEEVATFIADVQDGKYDGKPILRATTQGLRNKSFRKYLKLSDEQTGVAVIEPGVGTKNCPLEPDDVITRVGQYNIDNDGMVRLDHGIQLSFRFFIPGLANNGKFPASIIRDGQELEIEIPVDTHPQKLVPSLKGEYPDYFIYGPAVFVELTDDYLDSYLNTLRTDQRTQARVAALIKTLVSRGSPIVTRAAEYSEEEKLVIIPNNLLPHKIGKGYSSFGGRVVRRINGIEIKGIEHLVEVLRDTEEEFVRFEFADTDNQHLILEPALVKESMEDILDEYSIPRQGSKSLLKIWEASKDDDR